VKEAKLEDRTRLKLMPFPGDSRPRPSVDDVILHLRTEILQEGETPAFEEEAFPYEGGLTPLETQIFGAGR